MNGPRRSRRNPHAPRSHCPLGSLAAACAPGFTLIEVIVALALLVVVLVTSYQIFSNCLTTERAIEELTVPEKVGEGVLTVMRRDVSGAFFKGAAASLGNQVFRGVNRTVPTTGFSS